MDPKFRALLVFGGTVVALAFLEQSANRQATKLGVPNVLVGLIPAGIAHES